VSSRDASWVSVSICGDQENKKNMTFSREQHYMGGRTKVVPRGSVNDND
jgi:hypothetical protein